MRVAPLFLISALVMTLAACARAPEVRIAPTHDRAMAMPGYRELLTGSIRPATNPLMPDQDMPQAQPALAGRVLAISTASDIDLRPGEVVLTFDDGPHPTNTAAVLDALDAFGVKATFLMVGDMAKAHPAMARAVALRGHTVGTHSLDHQNLSTLGVDAALEDIHAGQVVVQNVLARTGIAPAPFFRFPYLAEGSGMRSRLAEEQVLVLDVDIDSEDYRTESAEDLLARTLRKLDKRGRGVVLFHDLHARTGKMLPEFLMALVERGYRVVQLVPAGQGLFREPTITASAGRFMPRY